jgi:RNA polymerase sigma-70 factor (ECF subfamily)
MFPPTCWTQLAEATLTGDPAGRKALEALCARYRPPVVSFLRSKGWNAVDADDLTQDLFAKLLVSRAWKKADRSRGLFRTFLLAILQHLISNKLAHEKALKNGGGAALLSLDWLEQDSGWEPASSVPEPCAEFDQVWALRTLRAAYARAEKQWEGRGKAEQFSVYSQFLPGTRRTPEYSEVATQLKVAEAAARKAVSRLRDDMLGFLRLEVAATVGPEGDLEAEMRYLGSILARPGMNHGGQTPPPPGSNGA